MAQIFSPYTSEQIQEFNSQPIAPFDTRYVKNPDGEEQAQAQSTESAAPFDPIPATITFK